MILVNLYDRSITFHSSVKTKAKKYKLLHNHWKRDGMDLYPFPLRRWLEPCGEDLFKRMYTTCDGWMV